MAHTYDIAILGATPAGLAAACCLAKTRSSVIVIDSPCKTVECPLADWVPAEFLRLAGLPRGLASAAGAEEFKRVTYHNADLSKTVEHVSRGQAGFVFQRAGMVKALASASVKAGAKIKTFATSPTIRLDEDFVSLQGPSTIHARMLLIARNHPNDVIGELSLPVRNVPQSHLIATALDVPLQTKAQKGAKGRAAELTSLAGTLHVVEMPERSDLGMFFLTGTTLHLRVISATTGSIPQTSVLSSLLARLRSAGAIPQGLLLQKARGAVWIPPAGVALDLETHVAKRCLLIGSAGGFADSVTGHTFTPSVKSGILASEVARAALAGKNLQETLMRFKTSWRHSLADFLRPPNTALGMILPLLFVNQRLVSKFTRALLRGESI